MKERAGGEALFSCCYLAPVEYYAALAKADKIWMEACEHYTKQSYRNRCRIVSANGVIDLSIPVKQPGGNKTPIRDVRISEHDGWQAKHWRAIESAYNSSPFFEYYRDDFQPFYEKKWNFLWDFNWDIQEKMLELLDMNPLIHLTDKYRASYGNELKDYRETIHPKLESKSSFVPYYQVFQSKFGFIPDMSIVDLLFNMGNEAVLIVTKQ
ncbi:MAG: WbqC family protein [Prevotellaceae bacterium]|nr:WbqC family protein [Prevotellaceae bacterium]